MVYNREAINELIGYIKTLNGVGDKEKVKNLVQNKFSLTRDRSVFYNDSFAIRFGYNGRNDTKRISNTVLSLSAIKNYDNKPLIFCIVTRAVNHLLLINSTFLNKVSHSSRDLRVDNIRGSINCSDIMMEYDGIPNEPSNFESLYAYHSEIAFEDNLERLVERTNNIVGRVSRFDVSPEIETKIMSSVERARAFVNSVEYVDLQKDLNERVSKVQGEIAIAAFIDNINLRGRIIEYLITDNGSDLKDQVISALRQKTALPSFTTKDNLGDYSKKYNSYNTETDIKTKVLFLEGNPKGYNIDKMLEFLSTEKAIYMIYLLGVDNNDKIVASLCSCFDKKLIKATSIQHHWAGRNTRGVTQFLGSGLRDILDSKEASTVDCESAKEYLTKLIAR
ncbi:MAG: hypothetical protein IJ004_02130 [Clostridia bacterium]|nr:hypothetical protein [Clostridia bacterium]